VIGATIPHMLGGAAGILLIAGLWTPIAGTLVTLIELWSLFSQAGDPWIPILLGTLGAAQAMLGPGAWSVDARLFGWKRIDPPDRKS
jgi:putative oxidoreductase